MNRASFLKRVGVLVAVATVDPSNLHKLLDKGMAYPTYPELLETTNWWFLSLELEREVKIWTPDLSKTFKTVAIGIENGVNPLVQVTSTCRRMFNSSPIEFCDCFECIRKRGRNIR